MLQLGTPDVASCPLDELISKYKKLIETVKETAPRAQIIITAVPHRLTAGSLDANQKADCLNNFLKSWYTEDPSLLFLDANPPRVPQNYHMDCLHFSYNGRLFFSHYLTNYLSHRSNFPQVVNFTMI